MSDKRTKAGELSKEQLEQLEPILSRSFEPEPELERLLRLKLQARNCSGPSRCSSSAEKGERSVAAQRVERIGLRRA